MFSHLYGWCSLIFFILLPTYLGEEEVVHKPPELFPVITPGFYGEENITKEMGYFHDYENESSWVTSNYEYQNRYSDTGEVNNYSFNVYRLTEHIYMFNIFQLDLSLLTYVMIDLKISDAECFSSATESSFIVFLATLTFDNKFVSWMSVRSEQFEYFENERVWIYNDMIKSNLNGQANLIDCFTEGFEDCVPRADVIFIQYDSEPEDTWAIDQIDVDIRFPLGPLDDDWHEWHFEHAVLLPCASWMREAKLYQIGPRNGLFITHNYRHQPKPGDWIRDWV